MLQALRELADSAGRVVVLLPQACERVLELLQRAALRVRRITPRAHLAGAQLELLLQRGTYCRGLGDLQSVTGNPEPQSHLKTNPNPNPNADPGDYPHAI